MTAFIATDGLDISMLLRTVRKFVIISKFLTKTHSVSNSRWNTRNFLHATDKQADRNGEQVTGNVPNTDTFPNGKIQDPKPENTRVKVNVKVALEQATKAHRGIQE